MTTYEILSRRGMELDRCVENFRLGRILSMHYPWIRMGGIFMCIWLDIILLSYILFYYFYFAILERFAVAKLIPWEGMDIEHFSLERERFRHLEGCFMFSCRLLAMYL
jgi:hypothetical protein